MGGGAQTLTNLTHTTAPLSSFHQTGGRATATATGETVHDIAWQKQKRERRNVYTVRGGSHAVVIVSAGNVRDMQAPAGYARLGQGRVPLHPSSPTLLHHRLPIRAFLGGLAGRTSKQAIQGPQKRAAVGVRWKGWFFIRNPSGICDVMDREGRNVPSGWGDPTCYLQSPRGKSDLASVLSFSSLGS